MEAARVKGGPARSLSPSLQEFVDVAALSAQKTPSARIYKRETCACQDIEQKKGWNFWFSCQCRKKRLHLLFTRARVSVVDLHDGGCAPPPHVYSCLEASYERQSTSVNVRDCNFRASREFPLPPAPIGSDAAPLLERRRAIGIYNIEPLQQRAVEILSCHRASNDF